MSWNPFRDAETRAEWRELLTIKQKGRCALCGHRFPLLADGFNESVHQGLAPTFDHIVPRAAGGSDELQNLRLTHRACNLNRGDGDGLRRTPSIPKALRADHRE